MPIAGHVPIGVSVEQASAAGLQSIEHMAGFRKSFAHNGEQLSRQWEKEFLDSSQDWYKFRENHFIEKGFTEDALQLLGYLHKQGVMIMAGTDNENPFTMDGFSCTTNLNIMFRRALLHWKRFKRPHLIPLFFCMKRMILEQLSRVN